MLYFDYSATTPMSETALKAYIHAARHYYGNSQSLHHDGEEADNVLQLCRNSLMQLLNVPHHSIYFTGSGSEANFLTIVSIALASIHKGKHIIYLETEHHSVKQALHYLKRFGFTTTAIPLNSVGKVVKSQLEKSIKHDTSMAIIGHASSELGTIQDLGHLSWLLKKHDILLVSDCVQSFGKTEIPFESLDAFTLSSHKIYGPKGLGVAILRNTVQWQPFLTGTSHEFGFRAGTVDIPAIVAFTEAAEEITANQIKEEKRLKQLQALLVSLVLTQDKLFVLEGDPLNRLPFHIALRRKGMEGQLLMLECKRKGIAISTSSACRAHFSEPPASLLAIGRSVTEAHEFIRITFGQQTTEEDIHTLSQALLEISATYKEGLHGEIKETVGRRTP